MNKKTGRFVALATAVSLAVALPAVAEENFTSSISGAQSGFLSRIWYDNNRDNVSTNVYFSSCDRDHQSLGLYPQVSGFDPNLGTLTICSNRKAYWGDLPEDDYRFKLIGGTNIDIGFVSVNW